METDPDTLNNRFKEYLRNLGLSFTPQRKVILEYLTLDNSHFNAEDLIAALRKRQIAVSRATVYRTLYHLEHAGFIRQVALESNQTYFEFIANCSHHEHLVCALCGKIVEFADSPLEERICFIAEKHGFQMTRHTIQITGICGRCRERPKA